MDSTPIHQYTTPTSARLKPLKSSKPILTPGYELCPCLIKMVWEQFFSEEGDENPYFHLCEFEQTCACFYIAGMSDETLRWKLFLFSLTGRAKQWYIQSVGSKKIWKHYALNFVYLSFPSLEWLAFEKRF